MSTISRNDFLDAFNGIDPRLIIENEPREKRAAEGKARVLRFALIAAAAAVLLAAVSAGMILALKGRDPEPILPTTENAPPASTEGEPSSSVSTPTQTPTATQTPTPTPSVPDGSVVVDGMTFHLDAELCAYTLVGFEKTGWEEYVIPDDIDGYPVTGIGEFDAEGVEARLVVSKNVGEIPDSVLKVFSVYGLSVDENNPRIAYTNGCLINKQTKTLTRGFAGCVIPDDGSVTTVGDHAFHWAKGLESVVVPDGIVGIGDEAFAGCEELKSVEIADSVLRYGEGLFVNCRSLEYVRLSSGAATVEDYMFDGCSSLSAIVLPEGVAYIGSCAFRSCTLLTDVYFPKSLSSVLEDAFRDSPKGARVHFPGNVKEWCAVSFAAFSNPCRNGGELYLQGERVTDLVIPSTIKSLPGAAFIGCDLQSVNLEEGVSKIGFSAFLSCAGLKEVSLPKSIREIEEGAFNDCPSLKTIRYAGTRADWEEVKVAEKNDFIFTAVIVCSDGEIVPQQPTVVNEGNGTYALNEEETGYVLTAFVNNGWTEEAVVPETVMGLPVLSVGDEAFGYSENLTMIVLPEGLVSIGNRAFKGCAELTRLDLPASLESIGADALCDSDALNEVRFGGTIKAFRAAGFDRNETLAAARIVCADGVIEPDGALPRKNVWKSGMRFSLDEEKSHYTLEAVSDALPLICEVPAEIDGLPVRYIGEGAFEGDVDLVRIVLPETLFGICDRAFAFCVRLSDIEYANGCPELTFIGKRAFEECASLTLSSFPQGLSLIDQYAFTGCGSLGSVALPAGMTTVGEHAFDGCTGLTSIDFSNSLVDRIDRSAFAGCTHLTSVTLPERVRTVGEYAFEGCAALESAVFRGARVDVGDSAFARCTALTAVELPPELEKIGANMFFGCTALRQIDLPGELNEICAGAFKGCSSLESVVIPDSVVNVGMKAFEDCVSLVKATLPGGYLKVDSFAFENCAALEELVMPSYMQISKNAFKDCGSIRKVYTASPDFWRTSPLASSKEFKEAEIIFSF